MMHFSAFKSLLCSAALLLTLTGGSLAYGQAVAFSVTGNNHYSSGGNTLLGYQTTVTNVNADFAGGGSTFTAHIEGLYVFTVSFTKDSYYGGTLDDVFVSIYHNGVSKGSAWSGEDAYKNRNSGTYTVALPLKIGDRVQTFVNSDAGYYRHLSTYHFTGYLVTPM